MVLCTMVCHSRSLAQKEPSVRISSEEIEADLYLPDPEQGYYRAARFDWSGVIPNLNFKGHTFFGQWFETYDPYVHESIVGPVEAFDPLGYEDSGVGETFTKVGVGLVEKIDTAAYHFGKPYPIINHGQWDVETRDDQVRFVHVLDVGDYPYSYEKVVRLDGNKMIIEHVLTNMGSNTIDSHVFNHNFFVIDQQTIGPGYIIRVPYEITYQTNRLGEFAELDSNQVRFLKALGDRDRVSLRSIGGYRPLAEDYDIVVENHITGVGVRITCDQPISKFDFWAANKTLCPEPFIHVEVEPADSFLWTITYEFFTL